MAGHGYLPWQERKFGLQHRKFDEMQENMINKSQHR
jgi:hypothetical protein